ncbi:MAG: anhydro-N-acetylmuramic acid kinase [Rhodobacteraceae bacterium]|nr:anhydro-N-acetylmuramic acid kinase [Paracoccaceae bacterium]
MKTGATPTAIWALGAMSGTSLDGVDAAMVLTDGHTISQFGPHAYRPYAADERETIRAGFGKWPGDPGVAAAAEQVESAHAEVLSRFTGAEIVGFHGQTLAHDPAGRGTHQCGDGAVLADVLSCPVVWDFRSNDVVMGGQGAPLAPFFHHACARLIGAAEPVAFLNLGGVGNLTWVDPAIVAPESPGALLAFDTGPANAPINDLMQAHFGLPQDEGGALAARGQVDEAAVAGFLDHAFFFKIPPKSLDRNEFSSALAGFDRLLPEDAAATLTAIAAASVARGAEHFPRRVSRVLVTGGGRHNATMMRELGQRLDCPVAPVEAAGLNGDMLEAQAFAYLAVRVLRGLPTSCPTTTGVPAAVGGGKISRPSGASAA